MSDLIARIQREIDTDVRLANGEDERAHNERHWPDRIERQARAFRKILELHRINEDSDEFEGRPGVVRWCETCNEPGYCVTVLALAEAYGIEP